MVMCGHPGGSYLRHRRTTADRQISKGTAMTITTASLSQPPVSPPPSPGHLRPRPDQPPRDGGRLGDHAPTGWSAAPPRPSWPRWRSPASPACTCASRQIGSSGSSATCCSAAGYLLMFGIEFIGAFVLPTLATAAPGYVNDVSSPPARRHRRR